MSEHQQITNNMKIILDTDVEPNIVSYISSIKNEEDYEEFMENLIRKDNVAHINAYNAIKFILFGKKINQKKNALLSMNKNSKLALNYQTAGSSEKTNNNNNQSKKGKKKFVAIREFQEKKVEKEGRNPCDCMGQEHEFLNNCLICGRIHCSKEGPGPCLFCGNEIIVRGDVQTCSIPDSKAKAAMRSKLNKVLDDDNDYFKINSKKTDEDGKKMMVVALDFASRRVIETTQGDMRLREMLLEDSMQHLIRVEEIYKKIQKQNHLQTAFAPTINKGHDELVDLLIEMRHKKPKETEELGEEDGKMPIIKYNTNIVDEDMIANIDQGLCLSMHQPYASLLVAGVKRHEGRVWPTNHRGRLWIAAAAKQPEDEEIMDLEKFYREFYKEPTLKFPKEYPLSCLLGCVTVEECLDQESYKKKFGCNEESSSPFVMICGNPIILPVFYPISGKHKIYSLDKELHRCAKVALQHAKYI